MMNSFPGRILKLGPLSRDLFVSAPGSLAFYASFSLDRKRKRRSGHGIIHLRCRQIPQAVGGDRRRTLPSGLRHE